MRTKLSPCVTSIASYQSVHKSEHYMHYAQCAQLIRWLSVMPDILSFSINLHGQVLMEHRQKDPRQVDWVKALKALFFGLRDYTKVHHAFGPAWNPRGVPLSQYKGEVCMPDVQGSRHPCEDTTTINMNC